MNLIISYEAEIVKCCIAKSSLNILQRYAEEENTRSASTEVGETVKFSVILSSGLMYGQNYSPD